jgi:hypothetical protein
MDINGDLLEKIMQSNMEFKKLYNEHTELKHKVEDLNKMKFITPEQELEKNQHKKQKLKAKDRLEQILKEFQEASS